jgi:hypothetical protein
MIANNQVKQYCTRCKKDLGIAVKINPFINTKSIPNICLDNIEIDARY